MIFNSCATISTITFTDDDRLRWEKEDKAQLTRDLNFLAKALEFKTLRERYGVWINQFWSGEYEDYGPEMDYPDFDENYEYYIQKRLQELIKEGLKK